MIELNCSAVPASVFELHLHRYFPSTCCHPKPLSVREFEIVQMFQVVPNWTRFSRHQKFFLNPQLELGGVGHRDVGELLKGLDFKCCLNIMRFHKNAFIAGMRVIDLNSSYTCNYWPMACAPNQDNLDELCDHLLMAYSGSFDVDMLQNVAALEDLLISQSNLIVMSKTL